MLGASKFSRQRPGPQSCRGLLNQSDGRQSARCRNPFRPFLLCKRLLMRPLKRRAQNRVLLFHPSDFNVHGAGRSVRQQRYLNPHLEILDVLTQERYRLGPKTFNSMRTLRDLLMLLLAIWRFLRADPDKLLWEINLISHKSLSGVERCQDRLKIASVILVKQTGFCIQHIMRNNLLFSFCGRSSMNGCDYYSSRFFLFLDTCELCQRFLESFHIIWFSVIEVILFFSVASACRIFNHFALTSSSNMTCSFRL